MTGKNQLIIDGKDWVKGMSSGANIADGGFSNETDAINITATPGVVYAPAIAVDADTDTRLTGTLIASCPDMNELYASNRLFVSDDGKGYRYNGTKLDAAGVALTAGKTWSAGFTDIITFGGEAYVTSKESITRWQNDNTIDDGADYPYTFTGPGSNYGSVPHPAIVYENNAYYGNKNILLQQTAAGVAPAAILTLDSSSIIIALGIDPGTGLMLISTVNTLDATGGTPTLCKLLWYDGNSLKVVKSVIIEAPIYGFHSNGGNTFVGYGKNIGYINGSGITFLRKLKNVTNVQAELPFKHHFASIGNTVYVLDGLQVLAYGEVLPGRKVFYYAFKNNANSNKPTMLADVGSGKLGYSFATTKFYTFDTTSVSSTNTQNIYTNKYDFPRPVYLRSLYIEYASAIANNDNNRSIYYQTEDLQTGLQILRVQGSDPATSAGLKNTSGAAVYFIDNVVGFANNKVRSVQFRYINDTTNYGLKRIIVYYDVAE